MNEWEATRITGTRWRYSDSETVIRGEYQVHPGNHWTYRAFDEAGKVIASGSSVGRYGCEHQIRYAHGHEQADILSEIYD